MDRDGRQVLPMIHYMENNKAPDSYELGNRDYFKKVVNQRGWSFPASSSQEDPVVDDVNEKNYYIQRLFNLNNGTRGTTLGLPLLKDSDCTAGPDTSQQCSMVLGADIVLSSLSLTEWPGAEALKDFIVMVVDQDSGEVLFHMDEDRSMIENIFQFGQGTEAITQKIRSDKGMKMADQEKHEPTPIPGHYHSRPGTFLTLQLAIPQWALLVFIPDENTDSYMSNLFLFNSISMAGALLTIALFLFVLQRLCDTGTFKAKLGIPLFVNRRKIMLFSSVYIAGIYFAYWVGSALQRLQSSDDEALFTIYFPFVAMGLSLYWGYGQYKALCAASGQPARDSKDVFKGAVVLIVSYVFAGGLLNTYLHKLGPVPASSLNWYYSYNLYPARLNQELLELQNMALILYPNSITRFQVDPLELMPISEGWRKELRKKGTRGFKDRHVKPDDIGPFRQITYATDPGDWVARYLLCRSKPCKKTSDSSTTRAKNGLDESSGSQHKVPQPDFLQVIAFALLMIASCALLLALWVTFNRRVLAARLYESRGFLHHLNQIRKLEPTGNLNLRAEKLLLDLKNRPPVGCGLALLVGQLKRGDAQAVEFEMLARRCPLITEVVARETVFPGLQVKLENEGGALSIHLWSMDACLAQSEQRILLLRLINQLKSLHSAGEISRLTIYPGFNNYENLFLKTKTTHAEEAWQQQAQDSEYASWAECLMAFSVVVPDNMLDHLDRGFIRLECDAFPQMCHLLREIPACDALQAEAKSRDSRRLHLQDWQKSASEWGSVNYLLVKAGALYRYKWECCSSAEKLALYHLANDKRINPSNTQVLEQLSMAGLIRVKCGRILIVNCSFAYFVRYAEDRATMVQMVAKGDMGAWQDYRAPITLLILLILGAIALTSGNSLYMIVASVLGVLGAIGNLTSSARIIHSNFQQ